MDNVRAILSLLDEKGVMLPYLLPAEGGLRGKLLKEAQGKCMSRVGISFLNGGGEHDSRDAASSSSSSAKDAHSLDVQTAATDAAACGQLSTQDACEAGAGRSESDNGCRWVLAMPQDTMSEEFRAMLETWRMTAEAAAKRDRGLSPEQLFTRRKLAVARAWTFATCGAAACYDGSGREEGILSLFAQRDPEAPKKSQLSLAVTEKLATGSVMSLGYTQLTQICRTRYVRGDAVEAQFSVGAPRESFVFWADLLPSVRYRGPGQVYCAVSDQTADFRSKAEREARAKQEQLAAAEKRE